MLKKLTAKIQQLNPVLTENIGAFSKCLVIEPGSQELLLKKGSIYTVFEISGNTQFEVNLITNVVHDVLHDSYYQSDNISPIQSLEKAISEVRDKVTQLANETIIMEKQTVDFKMLAGVLWGNVMYVVQIGEAKSYLMRTGEIRPISTMTEGTFSAASGVVKNDDVIIFCTNGFSKDFPPDRLLSVSIPENQLKSDQACLLMKFILDTNFTENEVVDFGLENAGIKLTKKNKIFSGILEKTNKIFKTKKSTGANKQSNKITAIPSIKLKTTEKIKFKIYYLVPIILLALGLSIYFTVTKRQQPQSNAPSEEPQQQETTQSEQQVVQPEPSTDQAIFYDLRITDSTADPTQIAVFEDFVVVGSKTSGKIYVSDRETPKFTALEILFAGVDNVLNIQGKLGFTDNEGYKVYDLEKNQTVESYAATNLGATSSYSDFVYSTAGNTLNRYTKSENKLVSTVWGENEAFNSPRSIGISYSVYILTADGNVVRFTTGEKDSFALSGDPKTLNEPVKLLADIDFKNIYIADKGNQRVVSFTKDGRFVKEYTADTEGKWADIKSIGVSPDEKKLYVLSGTKVYDLDL